MKRSLIAICIAQICELMDPSLSFAQSNLGQNLVDTLNRSELMMDGGTVSSFNPRNCSNPIYIGPENHYYGLTDISYSCIIDIRQETSIGTRVCINVYAFTARPRVCVGEGRLCCPGSRVRIVAKDKEDDGRKPISVTQEESNNKTKTKETPNKRDEKVFNQDYIKYVLMLSSFIIVLLVLLNRDR